MLNPFLRVLEAGNCSTRLFVTSQRTTIWAIWPHMTNDHMGPLTPYDLERVMLSEKLQNLMFNQKAFGNVLKLKVSSFLQHGSDHVPQWRHRSLTADAPEWSVPSISALDAAEEKTLTSTWHQYEPKKMKNSSCPMKFKCNLCFEFSSNVTRGLESACHLLE